MRKKLRKESNNSLLWNKRLWLSQSTTTSSRREKLTRIWGYRSPRSKLSSERDTLLFLKRSTTLLQAPTPTQMLISKETKYWLKTKIKSSIIITRMKNSLNIGSRPLFPMKLLARKLDKLTSLSLNTWLKFKPLKKLKTILRLYSLLVQMNGSLTLP